MAPSAGGHLLASKVVRAWRLVYKNATRVIRERLPQSAQPAETQVEPLYVHATIKEPINRLQAIRQNQNRWFSTRREIHTSNRHFSTTTRKSLQPPRSSYPQSRTRTAVSQLTSRAPFASTLRPNLTGGALGRTAGGYNLGGARVNGPRYFSHTPASPAEVIQNVSQAVRAFWLSGQKAHFHGLDARTGEKRFRAVSALQDKARNSFECSPVNAPGSFVDFKVSPIITALGPLSHVPRGDDFSACETDDVESSNTLTNTKLIATLEVDFARALKDLAAIMNDLKHLSALGSLPIMLVDATTLRVRFPGCDRSTLENLCTELNVRRGIVGEDDDFDQKTGADMALMFPFAPCETASEAFGEIVFENENHRPVKRAKRDHVDWMDMISPGHEQSLGLSHKSTASHDLDAVIVENPWLSAPSGYSSLHASECGQDDISGMFFQPVPPSKHYTPDKNDSSDYEGLQGIYRFIEECDRAKAAA